MAPPAKGKAKPRRWGKLRLLRIAISLFVLVVLFLSFTDFRQTFPNEWGHRLATIQFVPALKSTLAGAFIPSLIVLGCLVLGTLVFGRVYCSFICPLGIFQDVLARISKWVKGKKREILRYSPPANKIRYIILAVVTASFIGGYFVSRHWIDLMAWTDPYSQFGRMANMFANPVLAKANNALVGTVDGLYPVKIEWPRDVGWLWIPVLLLLLAMAVLAVWRGRLYCNTLCPVGSLLGLLSRFSLFRVTFDKSACTKCASCMKACKSQCIDLKKSQIDYSRCVNCFDCTAVCADRGLKYRFAWNKDDSAVPEKPRFPGKKTPPPSRPDSSPPRNTESAPGKPSENVMAQLPQTDRRTFMGLSLLGLWATVTGSAEKMPPNILRVRSRAVSKAIAPPGSQGIDHLLTYCTACHLCLDACPSKTLRPAYLEYGAKGFLKPHLTFEEGFCEFDCKACSEVCPNGAILPIALELKKKTRIGLAQFTKEQCIVLLDKSSCGACSEHCPTQALAMVPIEEVIMQPHWTGDFCARCTECSKVCEYGAITLIPDPDNPDMQRPIFDLDKCVGDGKCFNACEGGAIELKPAEYNLTIPKLDPSLCIGCGGCECACPVNAVVVGSVPLHEEANVKVEEQVVNPNDGVDFPF